MSNHHPPDCICDECLEEDVETKYCEDLTFEQSDLLWDGDGL